MRAPIRLAVTLAVLVVLTGCGGKRLNITGTVTRDGKPLEWPGDDRIFLVIFVPEERRPGRDPVSAETDSATGTFRVPEIRAGRYLVAIHQFDDSHVDVLQNKYDPVKTPLVVEVTEDNQVIDIDLPKDLP